MEIKEIHKKKQNVLPPGERDKLLKEMRQKDDKMVKGMFEFVDASGGFFEFTRRFYPGEPIQTLTFIHGEVCTIPMGIVRHINNTKRKIRKYNLSIPYEGGKPPRTFEVVSRVRFTPMDYL